jgi:hypothetical protein
VFCVWDKTRPALGPTRLPLQRVVGVKWPGREADHLPPSSTSVNLVTAWQRQFYVYCSLYNAEFLTAYTIILGTDKSGIAERFVPINSLSIILVIRKPILVESNLFRTCFRKNM